MAIIAIIVFAIICCKQDATSTPVPQSKDITIATGKTVTVNFTALPGTTPAWWDKLETALTTASGGFGSGDFILNVQSSGTGGFVGVDGSKTATVSNAFLSNSIPSAILTSLGDAMNAGWGVA